MARASTSKSDQTAPDDEVLPLLAEQQRETLNLLRQLIEFLLPKGDPDAPKLEELIASLVAQQRHMLIILRQLSISMNTLLQTGRGAAAGHDSREHLRDGDARA